MMQRGATILGVDGFLGADYDKYLRLGYLRDRAVQIGKKEPFVITEGSQADIVHSIAATYYSPCKHTGLPGPDPLSYYLNPKSEIWVQFAATFSLVDDNGNSYEICPKGTNYNDVNLIKEHIKWGYTRVINSYDPIASPDMNSLIPVDYLPAQCFDHKDNENGGVGDGFTDYPFDHDCTSFTDDDESK
jgi:hypothetical protein